MALTAICVRGGVFQDDAATAFGGIEPSAEVGVRA